MPSLRCSANRFWLQWVWFSRINIFTCPMWYCYKCLGPRVVLFIRELCKGVVSARTLLTQGIEFPRVLSLESQYSSNLKRINLYTFNCCNSTSIRLLQVRRWYKDENCSNVNDGSKSFFSFRIVDHKRFHVGWLYIRNLKRRWILRVTWLCSLIESAGHRTRGVHEVDGTARTRKRSEKWVFACSQRDMGKTVLEIITTAGSVANGQHQKKISPPWSSWNYTNQITHRKNVQARPGSTILALDTFWLNRSKRPSTKVMHGDGASGDAGTTNDSYKDSQSPKLGSVQILTATGLYIL